MHAFRLLLAHRRWSVLLCALALALRVMIPGGYMVSAGAHGLAVVVCPGSVPVGAAMTGMDHAMPAAGHGGGAKEHGQPEVPCAFSGLTAQALGAIDPVLLVQALAFAAVLALFAAPATAPRPILHLRPPLRGPPFPV